MLAIQLNRGGSISDTIAKQNVFDYRNDVIAKIALAPTILLNMAQNDTAEKGFYALKDISMNRLSVIFKNASALFAKETIGGLSPAEFAQKTTLVTGLPISVTQERCLNFLEQILLNIQHLVKAQSPDGNIEVFDTYHAMRDQANIGFVPKGRNLSVVLPGNHPSVNVIWLMSMAMKYPVILRPSFEEPFTPQRLALCLYEAGLPPDSLFYLPCDHAGADLIVRKCQRSIVFGGEEIIKKYKYMENTKIYGPGQSKIIVGLDAVDEIDLITDIVLQSMMRDGGRGCVNASSVIMPANAEKLAKNVAERLNSIQTLDPLEPDAQIPAVKDKNLAKKLQQVIEGAAADGAKDITAEMRSERSILQNANGTQFLLPTIVLCDNIRHPLFGKEFPFQFISISEVAEADIIATAGNSLAVTVVSEDYDLIQKVVLDPTIKKIYTGKRYTCDFDPAEPHEGYIAQFLFESKAYHPLIKNIDKKRCTYCNGSGFISEPGVKFKYNLFKSTENKSNCSRSKRN